MWLYVYLWIFMTWKMCFDDTSDDAYYEQHLRCLIRGTEIKPSLVRRYMATVWLCQEACEPCFQRLLVLISNCSPSQSLQFHHNVGIFFFFLNEGRFVSFISLLWNIVNILWNLTVVFPHDYLPILLFLPSVLKALCHVPTRGLGYMDVMREREKARGMAYSPSKAHLQGDNLMDVMDSAFSIHNLYGILSSKVQIHNECGVKV